MIWEHKTAPYIEIKSLTQARVFAAKQRRFGAGPLSSICQSKEQAAPDPSNPSKSKSGAEGGAIYFSKCGEKRTVKR